MLSRYLIGLCISISASLFLMLAGQMTYDEYQSYQKYSKAQSALHIFRSTLVMMQMLSVERGPTNALFSSNNSHDVIRDVNLNRARGRTDLAVEKLRAEIQRSLFLSDLEFINRINISLRNVRYRVNEISDRPIYLRDGEEIRDILQQYFNLIDMSEVFLDKIQYQAVGASLPSIPLIHVARFSAELREYAGRLGSMFSGPLAQQEMLSAEEISNIDKTLGKIDIIKTHLERSVSETQDSELALVLNQSLKLYFEEGLTIILRLKSIGQKSGTYGVDGGQFVDVYVPAMSHLFVLRDAAITVLENQHSVPHVRNRIFAVIISIILYLFCSIMTVTFLSKRGKVFIAPS